MKVLLIESEVDGHYLILYLKFIVRILHKKKCKIYLLTSKRAQKHLSLKSLIKECPSLKIIYINAPILNKYDSLSIFFYQIKLYRLIKKNFNILHEKYQFDKVFLNSIDHFEKALSIFGDPFNNIDFSGIFVNPKFHMNKVGFAKVGRFNFITKLLFFNILRIKNLKTIFTNDIFFLNYIKKNYKKFFTKLSFLYEPREFISAPKKFIAKKKLNIPYNLKNILVYGSCKKSKGIEDLIQIFKDNFFVKNICITIAGSQDKFVQKLLKTEFCQKLIKQQKIIVFKGFQDDYYESLIFNATDIVWVGYEKTFPFLSGVLFQAAIKKKPILASNHGIIGWMCRKFKLGYAFDTSNKKLLMHYLKKIIIEKNYKQFVINSKSLSKLSNPKFFIRQFWKSLT